MLTEHALSFLTLCFLELVLGIDNLIFVQLVANRVPLHQQKRARQIGLVGALLLRLLLLSSAALMADLTLTAFRVGPFDFSWRDTIFLMGGCFLLYKGGSEIHDVITGEGDAEENTKPTSLFFAIVQIMVLDVVFSLDSVITAMGMTTSIISMSGAVSVAMIVMIFAAEPIGLFVARHRTVKMLALTFLLLIALSLFVEAFDGSIPKGYLYFAIVFAIGVEALNITAKQYLRVKDEVKIMLDTDSKVDRFHDTEKTMIKSVLKLADKPIDAIITPHTELAWVDVNATPEQLLSTLSTHQRSRFLLCEGSLDEVIGVVEVKDLLIQMLRHEPLNLRTIAKEPEFIPEKKHVLEVLGLMKKSSLPLAVVVDEYGNVSGVVTTMDLLKAIIGEFASLDHDDDTHIEALRTKDNAWLFSGNISIDRLKELLNISHLPYEGEYQTLAGLVLAVLKDIPKPGQHFSVGAWECTVVAMDQHKIHQVLIRPL